MATPTYSRFKVTRRNYLSQESLNVNIKTLANMTRTTSKSGISKFQHGLTEQASFAQLTESNLLDPKVKGKEARIPWLTAKTSKGLSTYKITKKSSIYFTKQKLQLLK